MGTFIWPPADTSTWPLTHRLAASAQGKLLHVHGAGWHYWDGRRWVSDDRGMAMRSVERVLRNSLLESLSNNVLASDIKKMQLRFGDARSAKHRGIV